MEHPTKPLSCASLSSVVTRLQYHLENDPICALQLFQAVAHNVEKVIDQAPACVVDAASPGLQASCDELFWLKDFWTSSSVYIAARDEMIKYKGTTVTSTITHVNGPYHHFITQATLFAEFAQWPSILKKPVSLLSNTHTDAKTQGRFGSDGYIIMGLNFLALADAFAMSQQEEWLQLVQAIMDWTSIVSAAFLCLGYGRCCATILQTNSLYHRLMFLLHEGCIHAKVRR
ncbi:hypothetical protein EV421DRAFT_1733253 [Armillaria borealis]|uniref:Uncharacterized protein n=1 Tax=Armillaria borealis TaxID=47425 RepID=A0AA39MVZ3_9AGAR|nr:hypothetical protein EV421DRAFT_1733253 [Armillaria borealis]